MSSTRSEVAGSTDFTMNSLMMFSEWASLLVLVLYVILSSAWNVVLMP